MTYFRIELCPLKDGDLCVLADGPEGTQAFGYAMSRGESAAARFPKDAKWVMARKWSGSKLASLLSNTANYLVVHRELRDVFAKFRIPMESYGFDLYDHKKRLASRDYFIVNPLGTVDVLDTRKSKIIWSKEAPGEVVAIDAMVLDPAKLAKAPPILRVKEEPRAILFEQAVADALGELELTNVYGEELPIAS